MFNDNRKPLFGPVNLYKPKLFPRLRGKPAREIYRAFKTSLVTGQVLKPIAYVCYLVPGEMSKGVIFHIVESVGEALLGYVSTVGVCRWVYKYADVGLIKNSARAAYNICCTPITVYNFASSNIFDLCQVSNLETIWFGCPVYILDDKRFWIESNFTMRDAFNLVQKEEK